ncbi:MAG TPA: glycosyltransferase family 39 protein [Phycisphaeraceae bacterium]
MTTHRSSSSAEPQQKPLAVADRGGPGQSLPTAAEAEASAGLQEAAVRSQESLAAASRAASAALPRSWVVPALIAVTLLGAALRFYHLGAASFWVDELFTIDSTIDLAEGRWVARELAFIPSLIALRLAGLDISAMSPDQYHLWQALGITEPLARLPFCLIGIASIPILAILSQRLIGWRAALMLALLLAVSPWHVWMSQTARFYVQQFLLYNLCLLLYLDATERQSRWGLVGAAVCLVLAFSTQLTSLLIVGVFALDALIAYARRQPLRLPRGGWLTLAAAVLVCLGLWAAHFWHSTDTYTNFRGSTQSAIHLLLGLPLLTGVGVVVLAGLSAVWLYPLRPRLATVLVLSAVLPLVAFMGLALAGADVHIRYLFVSLLAWLMLAAIGLDRLWQALRPRLGLALALAPLAVTMGVLMFDDFGYYTGGMGYQPRWREAFSYVATHRREGQLVAGDYIPHIVGRYYLQDPDLLMLTTATTPQDLETMAAGQPMWIVVRGESATGGRQWRWLDQVAQLQTYFAARILQPYSSVHVYYYQPPAPQQPTEPGSEPEPILSGLPDAQS